MDTQNTRVRQRLGAEIAQVRARAGMKTQQSLAEAAELGLRTVVAVENGDKVSARTMRKIEQAVGLKTGVIDDYLAGRTAALPSPSATLTQSDDSISEETRQKIIDMTHRELAERYIEYADVSGRQSADEWLFRAVQLRLNAARTLVADQR